MRQGGGRSIHLVIWSAGADRVYLHFQPVEYDMATDSKNNAADDSGEIARECYDELADHYHLIFENWEASIQRQAAVLGPILEQACGPARTVRVLDCACGIGTQALGLAQQGFQVSGCDVSPR